MRKKKRKKVSTIFILIIVIILGLYLILTNNNSNSDSSNNSNNSSESSDSNVDDSNDSISSKPNDSSIEKDNNIDTAYRNYKSTSNFKLENLERYIAYHELHKDYSDEKIVSYVNIGLDKDFYSYIKDTDMSKENLILCNKYLKLPDYYEPDDLEEISSEYFIYGNSYVRKMRKEAKEAFEKLSKDSIEDGYPVYGQSAYREYEMQVKLYNSAVNSMGKEQADIDTARPGHSEHQTGLTIDVSSTKDGNMLNFENSDSFDWMQNNAHKYGFILRYRKDKVDITGFMYESWHYRYVGVKVATDMHDNYPDLSYEEYYYKIIDK